MELLILSVLLATSLAVPLSQSLAVNEDGSYQFYYETGKEGGSHSRSESKDKDGVVVGKFSYEDPTGEVREVNYKADDAGYVAKGDVSVVGAPKGQFPAEAEPLEEAATQEESVTTEDKNQNEELASPPEEEKPKVEETAVAEGGSEEEDIASNLTLEESVEDGPPEAFPQGFFLEKFQGLRRLPDPTKLKKAPSEDGSAKDVGEADSEKEGGQNKKGTGLNAFPRVFRPFIALEPFPSVPNQEWSPFMFHEPVYVFSYQQPESYGYHYFY